MNKASPQETSSVDGDAERTVLILGGYGNAGEWIATLLLKATTNVNIIVAGRSKVKAEATASKLNSLYGNERCSAAEMDASKLQTFSGIDLVVVAAPSTAACTTSLADAIIKAKVDYIDIQYSTKKLKTLRSMEAEIKAAGCCFITDGGYHPGMPAVLIRSAANRLDRVRKARVGGLVSANWGEYDIGVGTKEEFVSEFLELDMTTYKDGEWKTASLMHPTAMDFVEFGERYCIPMDLAEMHDVLDLYPDLQELEYSMAGFNWFVDWILTPFIMAVLSVCPSRCAKRAMGRLLFWGLKITSKPPYGTMLKAEVNGTNGGREVTINSTVYHEDGYFLTAAPVVACILQYLDGSIKKPGLWLQGSCVEPKRCMNDIKRLGVETKTEINIEKK